MSCSANCSSICRCNRAPVRQPRNRIDTMAPTTSDRTAPASLPADQGTSRGGRSPPPGPRGHRAWQVPVDPDIAVLLTSDLVTSAIMHGNGQTITLAIRCGSVSCALTCTTRRRSLPAADEPAATADRTRAGAGRRPVDRMGLIPHPFRQAVYAVPPTSGSRLTRPAFPPEPLSREPVVRRPPHIRKTPTSEGDTWKALRSGVRTNGRVQVFTAGLRAL
jgi:hypothetical protein